MEPQYLFGDIVVVEKNLIGVIVKVWIRSNSGNLSIIYEVYVRNHRGVKEYLEQEVKRYRTRHKELDKRELEWQEG